MTPEARARQNIDALLTAAGWHVCHLADIHAAQGVAICEFPLNPGHGFADYLLYINGKASSVIEADCCPSVVREVDAKLQRAGVVVGDMDEGLCYNYQEGKKI